MNLDRVTITGADDSVTPNDLLALSQEFPFVEWGILASSGRTGSPRFPSAGWLNDLATEAFASDMQLSLHLCGRVVRQLLLGIDEIKERQLLKPFQRIQLNFHAENTPCDPGKFVQALSEFDDKQIIFQIDGNGGNRHLESVLALDSDEFARINAAPLHDVSGGAGILPDKWPKPFPNLWCNGYAGGLSPDNLAEQLPLIAEAAGNSPFWIDVETHVRSDNDKVFDLDKVRRFLEIAKPHVKEKS